MPTISAQDMDIEINDGVWRLYPKAERLKPSILFETVQGSGLLNYKSAFGDAIGLPGNRLSTAYVRAVVVGYEPKSLRWLLGLHIADNPEEKPRWVSLVRWEQAPNHKYANDAQQAGRALAEFIGCPLKIFGVKKIPTVRPTGPLEQHERQDVDVENTKARAQKVILPLEYEGLWLGESRSKGLTLRVPKHGAVSQAGQIAPAYQLCEVDTTKALIKLVPPTGLLGGFFGGPRGREISFKQVRNIEVRHMVETISDTRKDDENNMLVEVSTVTHSWRVYLTLRDENILLAITQHTTTSDLNRRRTEASMTSTGVIDYQANVSHYRRLEEDQRLMRLAAYWSESAAYVLAAAMERPVAFTKVGNDIIS
ncbi:MAG: hypothetical protein H6673_00965 [Anaerolineales bacterium]|nr:hypothetical protein [Anaerolineales bacterium]